MRISDWSSDVCSSDLRMIGEIMRPEQALFFRRRRQEINVAIGPRALPQPLGDLDQHRDPARIVDRAVADAVGGAFGRADAEMVPLAEEQHRLAVGLGSPPRADELSEERRLGPWGVSAGRTEWA